MAPSMAPEGGRALALRTDELLHTQAGQHILLILCGSDTTVMGTSHMHC